MRSWPEIRGESTSYVHNLGLVESGSSFWSTTMSFSLFNEVARTYVNAGLNAIAYRVSQTCVVMITLLAGIVHGVVVQIAAYTFSFSDTRPFNLPIVSA